LKRLLVFAGMVLTIGGTATAQSTQWQLDPNHSSTQFSVRHMGISTVRGTFTKLSGTGQYDPTNPSNDLVEVTIDTASVDTRVQMRDNDLRSDHFFDTQKYPAMTFKSTKFEAAGGGRLKVTGDLTIHGVTKPITLDVEGPSKPVDDGHGHIHMGVAASGTVNRTDFGMTGAQGMVGNEISLTIDAEFVRVSHATADPK